MHRRDNILLRKLRRGDQQVFRELFDTYYQRLYLYAFGYVDDEKDAEDIVQDLFFHLWERHRDLDIFSSISAYLFRAVHNKSIQYLRHKKVETGYRERHRLKLAEAEILYGTTDFSFSNVQVEEIQQLLERAYNELPEKAKQIFKLSREENQTNKDIAKHLNVNIKTVEYHMTKSLRTFRSALRDYLVIFVLLATKLFLFL